MQIIVFVMRRLILILIVLVVLSRVGCFWMIGVVYVSVFDGVPRNKQQVTASIGSIMGEAAREGKSCLIVFNSILRPFLRLFQLI